GGDVRDERRPFRDESLETHLQPADASGKAPGHGENFRPRREVERDADPLGRLRGAQPSAPASPPILPLTRCARPTRSATEVPRASQYDASSPTSRPAT